MQAGTGVRPHFSCTVCHNQYDGLYEFKNHLESQEHELAYGIRLRNSMVRYFLDSTSDKIISIFFIVSKFKMKII